MAFAAGLGRAGLVAALHVLTTSRSQDTGRSVGVHGAVERVALLAQSSRWHGGLVAAGRVIQDTVREVPGPVEDPPLADGWSCWETRRTDDRARLAVDFALETSVEVKRAQDTVGSVCPYRQAWLHS